MRVAAFVFLLFCLGCSSVNLNLDPTPTPEVLRVTLGGKPTPDPVEMRSRLRELDGELADVTSLLRKYGYRVRWESRKSWPWPIQTQVAGILKDHGRIKADLMRMGELPTPFPTPTPCWRVSGGALQYCD